jgi:hypothetical protein
MRGWLDHGPTERGPWLAECDTVQLAEWNPFSPVPKP